MVLDYRDTIPAERSFNFLANIPLEEYGPCLQIKGDNSESHKHLEDITDGFSISAIKVQFVSSMFLLNFIVV